jgi:hypothetical protein
MTKIQKKMAKMAPNMNAAHMETLAIMVGSSLDGMPDEFFADIAAHASGMGPDRLAEIVAPYS